MRKKTKQKNIKPGWPANCSTVSCVLTSEKPDCQTKGRSVHFSNIINNNPDNSKQLFSTVKYLLNPQNLPQHNHTSAQCNKLLDHFTCKYKTFALLSRSSTFLFYQLTFIYIHSTTPVSLSPFWAAGGQENHQ